MTGAEFVSIREKCGLSQDQVAQYLGISRTTVWRIEGGVESVNLSIELSINGMKAGSRTFNSWLAKLPPKTRMHIRRRQHRHNSNGSSGNP